MIVHVDEDVNVTTTASSNTVDVETNVRSDPTLVASAQRDVALTLDANVVSGGESGGTSNYNMLTNKPTLNGSTIVGDMNEIDPTVPAWAKAETKPTYTADEVGALPSSTVIPDAYDDTEIRALINDKQDAGSYALSSDIPISVSQLSNDAGYVTGDVLNGYASQEYVQNAIPTNVSAFTNDAEYITALDVPTYDINANTDARHTHSNKTVLDSITYERTVAWDAGGGGGGGGTTKTKLSEFTDDLGSSPVHTHSQYLTEHQDISGKANTADLATVATSGSYNDLSNKPTIPTVPTALSGFTDDLGSSPTHTHSQYLSGTVAIAKGGTGATTAADARTNLGLGGAATYGVTTSVASGSTSLVTSGGVYDATLKTVTANGTKNYTNLTLCNVACARGGKTCSVTINIKSSVQINSSTSTLLFTIPSGYRIAKESDVALFSAGLDGFILVKFYTDGTVKSNLGAIKANTNYIGVIVYVCA